MKQLAFAALLWASEGGIVELVPSPAAQDGPLATAIGPNQEDSAPTTPPQAEEK